MLVSVLKKYFYVAGIDNWDLFFLACSVYNHLLNFELKCIYQVYIHTVGFILGDSSKRQDHSSSSRLY